MDQRWGDAMTLALNLAANSPCPDPNPRVGCVIVADGQVVGQGWHHGAGTSHAEVEALHQAGDAARGATAVVTLEPCTMCAGTIVAARIPKVVFGAFDPKAGAVSSLFDVMRDPRLPHRPEVVSGVMADESSALLREFFGGHRACTVDG